MHFIALLRAPRAHAVLGAGGHAQDNADAAERGGRLRKNRRAPSVTTPGATLGDGENVASSASSARFRARCAGVFFFFRPRTESGVDAALRMARSS